MEELLTHPLKYLRRILDGVRKRLALQRFRQAPRVRVASPAVHVDLHGDLLAGGMGGNVAYILSRSRS